MRGEALSQLLVELLSKGGDGFLTLILRLKDNLIEPVADGGGDRLLDLRADIACLEIHLGLATGLSKLLL